LKLRLLIPDLHIGLHCPEAAGMALEAAARLKSSLDSVIILGDVADLDRISAFARHGRINLPRSTVTGTGDQVWMTREFFKELRRIVGKVPIYVIGGNHGQPRWDKYIRDAKEVAPWVPNYQDAIGVTNIGATWVDSAGHLILDGAGKQRGDGEEAQFGDCIYRHGSRFGKYATEHNLWEAQGLHHYQGHSHRLKQWSKTSLDGRLVWSCECGHLGQQLNSYMIGRKQADWQQGFVIQTCARVRWVPQLVSIERSGERWECASHGIDFSDKGAQRGRKLFERLGHEVSIRTAERIAEDILGRRGYSAIGSAPK
jgi:hypothetical protein